MSRILRSEELGFVGSAQGNLGSLAKYLYKSKITSFGYEALVWLLTRAGFSARSIRLSSLVFWLCAVVVVERLARLLINRRAALVAAAVFVATPFSITSSFRIGYAPMLVFGCAMATLGFVRYLLSLDRRWLCLFGISGALASSAHLVGGLWLGVLAISSVGVLRPWRRRFELGIAALPALGITSVCLGQIHRRGEPAEREFHIVRSVVSSASELWGGVVFAAIFVVFLGSGLFVISRKRKHIRNMPVLVSLLVAGVVFAALEYGLSFFRPVFGGQNLAPEILIFALLAAVFGEIGTGAIAMLVRVGLIATLVSGSVIAFRKATRASVADLAVKVFSLAKPGDAIVFADTQSRSEFEAARPPTVQFPTPIYPATPWGASVPIVWSKRLPTQIFEQAADTSKRLWFVASQASLDVIADKQALEGKAASESFSNQDGVVRLYVFKQ